MTRDQDPYKLTFDDFASLAADQNLSQIEKIGFGPGVREGNETLIARDISSKLTNLNLPGINYLDIGPGCSNLPLVLAEKVIKLGGKSTFLDSTEMLSAIETNLNIEMIADRFPSVLLEGRKFDVILCYSVFHYVYNEIPTNLFFDSIISLLNSGGQLLIGDIPNLSQRNRFFSSLQGIHFHQQYTGTKSLPKIVQPAPNDGKIDDQVLIYLMTRARNLGYDSYILSQASNLPMSNRREDLLVIKK